MRIVRHAWLFSFLLAVPAPAPAQTVNDGEWLLERGDQAGFVRLTLRYGTRPENSSWTNDDVPLRQLDGLAAEAWQGSGVTVHFRIVRDAGTLACDGWFDHGKGSGHFEYTPSAQFVADLAHRGIGAPTPRQQFQMTMANLGIDLVDELAREGYERPSVDDLTRMATHGVDRAYLLSLDSAHYRLGSPAALIRMRDHGVDRDFIAELDAAGYRNLAVEQLVRVRDHGVDGDFIEELRDAGYKPSDIEELVETRDHGVDARYAKELKDVGLHDLSLSQLRRARDHGLTAGFVRRVASHGYTSLSLDELIRLRDRGLD
jgi:hypothetical protein